MWHGILRAAYWALVIGGGFCANRFADMDHAQIFFTSIAATSIGVALAVFDLISILHPEIWTQ